MKKGIGNIRGILKLTGENECERPKIKVKRVHEGYWYKYHGRGKKNFIFREGGL
jgi:hypothetical protein